MALKSTALIRSAAGFLMTSALLLSGCNSEDNSKAEEITETPIGVEENTRFHLADIAYNTYEDSLTKIKIASYARSETGEESPYLTKVTPLGDNPSTQCQSISTTDTHIILDAKYPETCIYSYQVSNKPTSSMAVHTQDAETSENIGLLSLAIQPRGVPIPNQLPPITVSGVQEGANLTFNMDSYLASTFPKGLSAAGAELDSYAFVLGTGIVDVDSAANTITYTSSINNNFGNNKVNRVIYSITQSDGTRKVGTIGIPISTKNNSANNPNNTPPTFSNFTYTAEVREKQTVEINIDPYTSDADGDELQIIGLHSFNTETKPASAAFNNQKFTFMSHFSGTYHVVVDLSDHEGGITTGVVKIQVKSLFPDILVANPNVGGNELFRAPLTLPQANYLDIAHSGHFTEKAETGPVGVEVAVMNYYVADAMCKMRGGQLPTLEQMNYLINSEHNKLWIESDTNNQVWPIGQPYFTSDVNEKNQVKMVTFSSKTTPDDTSLAIESDVDISTATGYVTCVDLVPVELEIDNNYALINAPDFLNQQLLAYAKTENGVTYLYERRLDWVHDTNTYLKVTNNVPENTSWVEGILKGTETVTASNFSSLSPVTTDKQLKVIYNLLLDDASVKPESPKTPYTDPYVGFEKYNPDNLYSISISDADHSLCTDKNETDNDGPLRIEQVKSTAKVVAPSPYRLGLSGVKPFTSEPGDSLLDITLWSGSTACAASTADDNFTTNPRAGELGQAGYRFTDVTIPSDARYIAVVGWLSANPTNQEVTLPYNPPRVLAHAGGTTTQNYPDIVLDISPANSKAPPKLSHGQRIKNFFDGIPWPDYNFPANAYQIYTSLNWKGCYTTLGNECRQAFVHEKSLDILDNPSNASFDWVRVGYASDLSKLPDSLKGKPITISFGVMGHATTMLSIPAPAGQTSKDITPNKIGYVNAIHKGINVRIDDLQLFIY